MAGTAPSRLTPTLGPLFSVATVVVIVFGLQAAQAVVIPVLLALFFAMMAWPGLLMLRRHGVPAGLALLIVVSGMMGAVLGVGLLVGASMTDFASRLPRYQAQARAQFGAAMETLQSLGVSVPNTALLDFIDPGAAMGLVSGILTGLSGALGEALLIFTLMLFLLIEGDSFPRKLKAAFGTDSNVTTQIQRFTSSVNTYMKIKTIVSAITGLVVAIWVAILGVPYALLWGFVAFLLNFVPNIGSIIAAVPAVLLALIELGPGSALAVALGYLVVNLVMGNAVEPRVMGRGLGLSAAVVLLSLVCWGWVLGPVGMVLSVPLTMTIKLALESSQDGQWLAVLLGTGTAADRT